MAEIVNLRQARKARRRADAARTAADNRVRFGTPSAMKRQAELESARAKRAQEGRKLVDPTAKDESG